MADIAMLLLIFFMSTSIIQTHQSTAVRLPGAMTGEAIQAEDRIRISVGPSGEVAFNDARVPWGNVGALLAAKRDGRPDLVITLYADARTPYAIVAALLDQLKAARAPRVILATTKRGGA
jgi:biopolymer transport protein ExbD